LNITENQEEAGAFSWLIKGIKTKTAYAAGKAWPLTSTTTLGTWGIVNKDPPKREEKEASVEMPPGWMVPRNGLW